MTILRRSTSTKIVFPSRFSKSKNEIHTYLLPNCLWNRQGLKQSLWRAWLILVLLAHRTRVYIFSDGLLHAHPMQGLSYSSIGAENS